jgi:uncharacterized membrane protein
MFKPRSGNPIKWVLWGIVGVCIAAVLALFFGMVVMWLWNWLMPTIFGLPTLTYWQAWGIVILFHILFKVGCHDHHSKCSSNDSSENHFKKNWKSKFKQKMKDDFCCDENNSDDTTEVIE